MTSAELTIRVDSINPIMIRTVCDFRLVKFRAPSFTSNGCRAVITAIINTITTAIVARAMRYVSSEIPNIVSTKFLLLDHRLIGVYFLTLYQTIIHMDRSIAPLRNGRIMCDNDKCLRLLTIQFLHEVHNV